MEILLGLITALFWPVLIIVGIVWLVKKLSKPPTQYNIVDSNYTPSYPVSEWEIRKKVAAEIRAQGGQYKTAGQKKVVEEMAQTVEYFASHSYAGQQVVSAEEQRLYQEVPQEAVVAASMASTVVPTAVQETIPYETPWKKLQLLDSVTILLYLGAFLLLASIGLYIGFGSGTAIKAVLALLITFVFYFAGLQLYERTKRLRPAGLTFVAIGMATLPMAGAATYFYGFDKTNGAVIWLATSVIGLFMYVLALIKLKSPLISYIVVFSSLSVVLSSISALGLAPYYFIQGLGISGLIFLFISQYFSKSDIGIKEAYEQSSAFFVPFSIGMSVLFVSKVGWLQLALSLMVGALYYAYTVYITGAKKPVYALLAQLMFIPSIITGAYGLSSSAVVVRALLCLVVVAYILVWLGWASIRILEDEYRLQIKGILLAMPLVAVAGFISAPHALWVAVAATVVAGLAVYAKDRDSLSGTEWTLGLLALPIVVGLLAYDPRLSTAVIGEIYVALLAVSVLVGAAAKTRLSVVDRSLQRSILLTSVIAGALFQISSPNTTQVIIALLEVFLVSIASWYEDDVETSFALSATLFAVWLIAYLDDFKLFVAMLAAFLGYNLLVAQHKATGYLHSWYATLSMLALPAIYGLLARSDKWGSRELWIAYGVLTLLFVAIRAIRKIITPASAVFGFVIGLIVAMGYAYSISPSYGLWTAFGATILLYFYEWLTKNELFGYLAPLLPLTLVFDLSASSKLVLLMASVLTGLVLLVTALRRRSYEAYLSVAGLLVLPWYAGSIVYGWQNGWLAGVYLGMSGLFILARQLLKPSIWNDLFRGVCMFGYMPSLVIGIFYGSVCGWKVAALMYFLSGLLFTAISYVESSPPVIIMAFILGYAAILRYTTGLELSVNYTVSILLALTQGTYWALVLSKLATVRAAYARGFQLCVAVVIPLLGLGYPTRPIFPLALALFGGMLLNELWERGQASRESAILIMHTSLLWWLYTLGVREFQVYTQSTAALIGLFAYWRRALKDTPSVINQYLWAAVLAFSIPMVWQAITSGNVMYAYLVLVEHVALILISIAFKRATFAWWGIAVVVASVLYQLRKLRYAALAFLGAFIIALAVYFLLRYNKPDQNQK